MIHSRVMTFISIFIIIALISTLWVLTRPVKEEITVEEEATIVEIEEEAMPLGPPSIAYQAGYGITWQLANGPMDLTYYTDEDHSIDLTVIGNSNQEPGLAGASMDDAEDIVGSTVTRFDGSRIPKFTYDFKQFYTHENKLVILYYDLLEDKVLFALQTDGNIATKTNFFTSRNLEPYAPRDFETMTMQLLNAVRTAYGKAPVQINNLVADTSREHSQSMVNGDYFAHINTQGLSPKERLTAADIQFSNYGEALTAGIWTPMDVIATWMNSPAHRDILLGDFTSGGVGVAYGDATYGIYYTLNLIKE